MRKYIFFILFFLYSFAQAQFVTIPDANFRNYLMTQYPSCFNANQQMDTTCSGIVNALSLYVRNSNISNLDGVQYFENLKYLNCSDNLLTSLPTLPKNLTDLYCTNNLLTSLPTLPNSLTSFDCGINQLTNLPSLPNTLYHLYCFTNQLTSLPSLPNNLTVFACSNNFLTSLPSLPNNMESFSCINNFLTSLPELPTSLKHFNCSYNQLTYLPTLPPIDSLFCSNNALTSLPSLPNSLVYLDCSNNPLLSCLPILPYNLILINETGTSISCIPNFPPLFSTALPICPIGSSCETKPTASGIVFHDINANGMYEIGVDSVLTGCVITNSNGWSASSMQNGEYQMKLDSGVVNSVSLSPFTPYAQSTPTSYQITPTSAGSQGSNFNFAVTFMPNVQDLRVDVTAGLARPGFNQWCSTTIHNVGTLNVSNASLKILKPSTFNFLNANPPISQQIGDTLIWNNINISALQQMGFYFNLNVPTNATLGTPYQIQAWVFPTLNDTTPANNQTVYQDSIIGSFDPNDKAVNISQLDPDNLDQELKYTIRFQNTGTDTAFTVFIRDTLSNQLDMSTFKIVGASHPYSFIVRDHGLLEVFFQNILLPDSFTNEPKSHGFVQYVAKPKSTLQIGDQILNTASIYFDFNLPVVTNTVVTEMKSVSREHVSLMNAQIYPNPSNGKIRIELASNELTSLTITDLTGKILIEKSVSNGSEIDLVNLTAGVYLAKLENKSGVKVVKLVRE